MAVLWVSIAVVEGAAEGAAENPAVEKPRNAVIEKTINAVIEKPRKVAEKENLAAEPAQKGVVNLAIINTSLNFT